MAAAHRRSQFDLAAWLGHIIANCHRGKHQPPYTPAQMHPDTAGQAAHRPHKLNRGNFRSFVTFVVGPNARPTNRQL